MITFEKKTLAGCCVLAVLAAGVVCAGLFLHQTPSKSRQIFADALSDMHDKDYSNAYYLFSRISFLSNLKPIALYHQGECADKLEDYDTAVKKYKMLFPIYPSNKLSLKAKYLAAQNLVNTNPNLAEKYFKEILESAPHSDYAIAAEYYLGLLLMKYYTEGENKIFPLSKKDDAENFFRHYLKKAPSGRLALNVINDWLSLDKIISSDDYLMMAKSCILLGENEKAQELLNKVNLKESWAVDVQNSFALNNIPRVKYLTEWGLMHHAQYIDVEDIEAAVDTYLQISPTNYQGATRLFYIANSKGKDYIWDLKCSYTDSQYKSQCFKDFYLKYPDSKYVDDALSQIFLETIRKSDYRNAKKIGQDFLNKFKNSEFTPMVLYWMGRVAEKTHDYSEYMSYYKSTIARYPDSYYAYRAYLHMNHTPGPIITNYLKEQEVLYPYKNKPGIIKELVELKDFDILEEFAKDDDFLKSWIAYQKGEYTKSVVLARNAMSKLSPKPDKYDLRWRLVYPLHYYADIKKYADIPGNNSPLMLSIVREESYFNPSAKSSVGALGLMQLMPQTASEIAAKHGVNKFTLYDPAQNIMLGNYYYAFLKTYLSGMDVSAIAAYNGGIGSVNNWKKSIYYNDTDEFVEQIPYPETKNYVKKVFRSYWNYIRIYSGNE